MDVGQLLLALLGGLAGTIEITVAAQVAVLLITGVGAGIGAGAVKWKIGVEEQQCAQEAAVDAPARNVQILLLLEIK